MHCSLHGQTLFAIPQAVHRMRRLRPTLHYFDVHLLKAFDF